MLTVAIRRRVKGFELDVALQAALGVTALFGPSGAGKTTIARCVAGLTRPDAGCISLGGRILWDGSTDLPPHRRGIGYVFQEPRLFPHLTVRANLVYGAGRRADPKAVTDMLGIGHLLDRRPGGLSGGEAARVAIGRALLRAPDLLILDEPLAALDARRRERVMPWLERLRGAGLPILYISHAIEEVARLADQLVLLREGRVLRAGPVAGVLSDPAAAAIMGPSQAGAVLEGVVQARDGGLVRLATPAGPLWVPGDGPVGARLRVRIRAEDVLLATESLRGLSALNVLPAIVTTVQEGQGPGLMLRLAVGDAALLARVMRRSQDELGFAPGRQVWAIVQAGRATQAVPDANTAQGDAD